MPSRVEAAAILGVSERSVRRHLAEFPAFFNDPAGELSATDLELLRIIIAGKSNGKDTGDEIRQRLAAFIQEQERELQSLPSLPSTSVQDGAESFVQSGMARRQTFDKEGGNVVTVTREELAQVVTPMVRAVETLAGVNRKLAHQVEVLTVEVASLRRRAGPPPAQVIRRIEPARPSRNSSITWLHKVWLELTNPMALRENEEMALV